VLLSKTMRQMISGLERAMESTNFIKGVDMPPLISLRLLPFSTPSHASSLRAVLSFCEI
jgi:hypothetical protein